MRLAPACLLLGMFVGACVPQATTPPPAPLPAPVIPPPTPSPPAPVPIPVASGWEDAPLSPGDWSYRAGTASFAGPDGVTLTLRCANGQVLLGRPGAGGALAVTSGFGSRTLAAEAGIAAIAVNDALLDQLAFSRGRLLVRADGTADLIAPAWPEIARVVEDCRGH